jgi:hypothetical protein
LSADKWRNLPRQNTRKTAVPQAAQGEPVEIASGHLGRCHEKRAAEKLPPYGMHVQNVSISMCLPHGATARSTFRTGWPGM